MKKRVIIIGGGFAGISAAKGLKNSDFDVLLIDKKNHHLFQPLLYQVASAALSPGDISVPLREVIGKYKNIKILLDEVISIDKKKKQIICQSNQIHSYDYLILAPGSRPNYFGNSEWRGFAPGLKTLEDAVHIRNKLLKSFEDCENQKKDSLNIVIIGAGPTGVELAGAFAEIAYDIMLKEFKNFDSKKAKIYLLEGGPDVLPSYKGYLSKKAKQYIEDLGVIVLNDHRVEDISSNIVRAGNLEIESQNIIWAAGNKASNLMNMLDSKQDRMGRVIVESNLSLKDHPEVFIIGDSAHVKGANHSPLPPLAPVASQQGRHVAKQLKMNKSISFKYFDKGNMATIGNFKAVMEFKNLKIAGFCAWISWCFIHIFFLIDFRNRALVFMQWVFSFIFRSKGVRIITDVRNE